MSATTATNTPNLSQEFLRVINWLGLNKPLSDDAVVSLNTLFERARQSPDKEFLMLVGDAGMVQVMGGFVISQDVPQGVDFKSQIACFGTSQRHEVETIVLVTGSSETGFSRASIKEQEMRYYETPEDQRFILSPA